MRYAGWREHEDVVDSRDDRPIERDVFRSHRTANQSSPRSTPVVQQDLPASPNAAPKSETPAKPSNPMPVNPPDPLPGKQNPLP